MENSLHTIFVVLNDASVDHPVASKSFILNGKHCFVWSTVPSSKGVMSLEQAPFHSVSA